jgi:hypothetical protein
LSPGRADGIEGVGDDALDRLDRFGVILIDDDIDRQELLVAAAQHGKRAMARRRRPALGLVEIIGELRAGLLLAFDHLGTEIGIVLHIFAQALQQVGVFGQVLDDDVACAFERCLGVRHLGGKELSGAVRAGTSARSARICSASGPRPRSRAISALVRRFGL